MDDAAPSKIIAQEVRGPEPTRTKGMNDQETAYMRGDLEPVTSSILISNSKYLNSPVYRDAWAQASLRRLGHDLSPTYHIPMMSKAVAEVVDHGEAGRLIEAEKAAYPEFAHWLQERKLTRYDADELGGYAKGTLGATIGEFLRRPGFDMEFMGKEVTPRTDLEYLGKRYGANHDIDHMVSGFGSSLAGEQALSIMSVTMAHRFFSPELARYIARFQVFTTGAAYKRYAIHYPVVMQTILEAMQLGIEAGRSIRMPLFMVRWEDYLDWTLDDIADHLGFKRGPGEAWDWTTEAASG